MEFERFGHLDKDIQQLTTRSIKHLFGKSNLIFKKFSEKIFKFQLLPVL